MVDSLNCLRHDAVVSSDDQNSDIRNGCAAGTDSSKCFMSGCIEEGDRFSSLLYLICTDMLCDAADLSGLNTALSDVVEYRGFAVVDVSHDDNNRCSGLEIFFRILDRFVLDDVEPFLDGNMNLFLYFCTKLLSDKCCCIEIDDLRDGCHNSESHEFLDNCGSCLFKTCCKFSY